MPKNDLVRRIDLKPPAAQKSGAGGTGTIYANKVLTNDLRQSEAQGGAVVPAAQVQAWLEFLTNYRVSREGDVMVDDATIALGRDAVDEAEAVTLRQLNAAVDAATQGSEATLRVDNQSGVVQFIVEPDYFRFGPPTSPGITYDWSRDNKVRVALETLDPPISTGVITDFTEAAQDAVGGILTDTTTIDFTYTDATPSITADVKTGSIANSYLANMTQATIKGRADGAGTGAPVDLTASQLLTIVKTVDGTGSGLDADLLDGNDSTAFATSAHSHATYVVGPGSSTDNAFARWDTTTGYLVQNSSYSSLDDNGQATFQAGGATYIPLTVKGAASQSGNLLNISNSSGSVLTQFDSNGWMKITNNVTPSNTSTPALYVQHTVLFSTGGAKTPTGMWITSDVTTSTSVSGTHIGLLVGANQNSANVVPTLIGAQYQAYLQSSATQATLIGHNIRVGSNYSSGANAITNLYGFRSGIDSYNGHATLKTTITNVYNGHLGVPQTGQVIGATITNLWGLYIADTTMSTGSTMTNQIGLEIASMTSAGTSNIALKTNTGTVQFGDIVKLVQTTTLTGGVTDSYTAAMRLTPTYTAATAQTVTRHNYIDINTPTLSGAGPAAVTDAAVFRFDAAAGTHKAVDSSSTKTTPGGVDAWVKININGTIYYMPAYTSKTA